MTLQLIHDTGNSPNFGLYGFPDNFLSGFLMNTTAVVKFKESSRMMRKMTILFLVLLPGQMALAQLIKCKCAENTIDSFTGFRIVESKSYVIGEVEGTNNDASLSVRRVDSTYFITLASPIDKCVGSATARASFKNVVGEVFTLEHMGEVNCGQRTYLGYGAYVNTLPTIRVQLNEKTKALKTHGISMIRLEVGQSYVNILVSSPLILKQIFDCVDTQPLPKSKK